MQSLENLIHLFNGESKASCRIRRRAVIWKWIEFKNDFVALSGVMSRPLAMAFLFPINAQRFVEPAQPADLPSL